MLKYEQIALDIQKKINNGQYLPNDQLPLEKEMCIQYNVSRITIKKAMDKLVMNGSVVKRRGAGTFVKDVDHEEITDISTSKQFNGFSGSHRGEKIETKVIDFKVINPSQEIANKLKMEKDDFVYYICRVRYADGEPCVVEYTYMPIDVISGIKRDMLTGSIYRYIVRALVGSELEKEALDINDTMPILQVEQIAFLDNGQPFEYSKSSHRGDKFEFKSISVR